MFIHCHTEELSFHASVRHCTFVSEMVRLERRLCLIQLHAELFDIVFLALGGREVGAAVLADQLPGEVGAAELEEAAQGISVLK